MTYGSPGASKAIGHSISELVAEAERGHMYGEAQGVGRKTPHAGCLPGVQAFGAREGAKRLVSIIEQIVDLDEPRELLPTCPDPTIHNEVATQSCRS